jgi:hypothetical protein
MAKRTRRNRETIMIIQEENRVNSELSKKLMLCYLFKKAVQKSPSIADYSLITAIKKMIQ